MTILRRPEQSLIANHETVSKVPQPVQEYLQGLWVPERRHPEGKAQAFKGFRCPVGFLRDPIKKHVTNPLRRRWRKYSKSKHYTAIISSVLSVFRQLALVNTLVNTRAIE
eukprot:CAMPEP_0202838286 /NCGR_PEP_ID=MMETSP1389-20130828/48877_1 /ASSEMBLY_ACC=CAM_ASM_000865 /TAXON_ID=302021 /ORGANISM="Rhodomonas sp., Strain CCMP768" /LENGTH=109 /DNA_ID=CAMNT_0049514529 /DNA_START=240 /DNA_END=566 /DNA_ORIENTATION=+